MKYFLGYDLGSSSVKAALLEQGTLTKSATEQRVFEAGTPVNYRVGDQPNNVFSLSVPEPGAGNFIRKLISNQDIFSNCSIQNC